MVEQKNDKNHHETLMNPMLIESYFDGELKSDEFDAICHEDIVQTETWKALDELRQVVRTESELALDDVDGFSLLEAIHKDIDAYEFSKNEDKLRSVSPVVKPMRQDSGFRWKSWIPAIAAAALFLASIPGLVQMFWMDAPVKQEPSTTVVYMDSNNPQKSQDVVCPAPQYWHENQPLMDMDVPSNVYPQKKDKADQLTVDEMDNAIRHLIRRIETLEEANQERIERGDISLQHNSPDEPIHQM